MRDFFSATESVNAKLKQGYFAANGTGYKVLTGQLDEESLQLFQNHQQLRFVELMNQRLGLDESQKEILRAFVHKHATEHGALLFEHQAFFEAVLSSDLNNLLDEARANGPPKKQDGKASATTSEMCLVQRPIVAVSFACYRAEQR